MKLIPVRTEFNTQFFVAEKDSPSWDVNVGDITVSTNFLAVGKEFDLLGISQSDELLASGTLSPLDLMLGDPIVRSLLVKVRSAKKPDGECFAIDVTDQDVRFLRQLAPLQYRARVNQILRLSTEKLHLSEKPGTLFVLLSGEINHELGNCFLKVADFAAGVGIEIIGYTLEAERGLPPDLQFKSPAAGPLPLWLLRNHPASLLVGVYAADENAARQQAHALDEHKSPDWFDATVDVIAVPPFTGPAVVFRNKMY